MNFVISLENITEDDRDCLGGKAYALGILLARGLRVPPGLCISSKAYEMYVRTTGLMERISMELCRKDFDDMRWEEMWDTSLRIRNMFLNTPMPLFLVNQFKDPIEKAFDSRPVAVRSSAPGEDSASVTFAGIHETYMNVRGVYSIIEHVRLVWASLWADGALLYRQEMGLDVTTSSMAVLIQELVSGEKSGVVFGENPNDETQAVVESVYGLNQGLVDGTVEPDRWTLDRRDGRILSHHAVNREHIVAIAAAGVHLEALPGEKRGVAPLDEAEVGRVFDLAAKCQEVFGCPQDVEWTFQHDDLYLLQSRPITTLRKQGQLDDRAWYLTLRRSFVNLRQLRAKIEDTLIPDMVSVAGDLSKTDCTSLSEAELADEILRRGQIFDSWEQTYWRYFIPFAHGMRLFGQVYNDAVRPVDPYEFMDLLATADLISIRRNAMLEGMADCIRRDSALARAVRMHEDISGFTGFMGRVDEFVDAFGDLSCGASECTYGREALLHVVQEMATRPAGKVPGRYGNGEKLTQDFLSLFTGEMRDFAAEVLDIARASYRLRDDDNIYLGRIRRQMLLARDEGMGRLKKRGVPLPETVTDRELARSLRDPGYVPQGSPESEGEEETGHVRMTARQLTGQPASRGIVTGIARVLENEDDLLRFRAGEIMVCDALDPSMTFIVPLASGIVERRGGMLIHGAIMAREYSLPCVTGVPDATELIRTGSRITVDGYLGIVILD